ncbi:2OGFeDO family oxygenase domain protein [Mycena kentingensis (nom. inval.)]|nr:2OGFeDO family oxygenase domain protein [Mycena kentingensis (nom. inval.)]
MYNRQSGTHVDSSDPRRSYVALSAHGPFNGGALNVPEIGVRIRYDARTIILLRGRVLAHRAESWTCGQRVSIAHFTHRATFGMVPPEHDPSAVGERVYAW